ncbi:Poly A polymerase head domain protein [Candidatus Desulfosporosinus infrequens]|uniref:Poly A polymerase head domain protein n=1 Tax=Candidatus Desulfosporosinus infrequens TaxID=2043169 RepID=A0A2U3LHG7_9FIRM|nr:Poly A polymerase head domain protein [Candidatus Desulfosporosinus infrequens]
MIGTPFQQEILKRLSELGPVYIVGGAVRDAHLGIPSKDVDAVMSLSLPEIKIKLSEGGFTPHLMGAHQQTVSLFRGTERVDISGFSGEVETDALRRDFTVNAIYQDVRTGEIKDPLNGLHDLRAKRIKACGCAADRFKEDPLRILRLIRLATRYSFEIETGTWRSAVDHVPEIRQVALERITEELGRILILAEVDKALGLLDDLGYFQIYIPELARLKGLKQNRYHTKDAWEHTRQVVKNTPSRVLLRLAALFHDLGKWETASRECYAWGTIRLTDQGYEVDGIKLVGKNLVQWRDKVVEVHGGRLDNYPDTIVTKRIKAAQQLTHNKRLEMVPEGKRHFLQHEWESARLVKEILPRFRWSVVLPGGRSGERELHFLVGHHMLGSLTFMSDLKTEGDENKVRHKARRFAWEIGWNGQNFVTQRVENLLDLWRADFLGGKQDSEKNSERFDWIQGQIKNACGFLTERADQLEWASFEEFVRGRRLCGERFGQFKEQVRRRVMTDTKYRLSDPQFLEQEYRLFQNNRKY